MSADQQSASFEKANRQTKEPAMHIRVKRGWELPESAATPEGVFLNRRRFAAALAAGPILAALGAAPGQADEADPSVKYYPAKRNNPYKMDRGITPEALVTSYNNYYEFGSSKDIASDAQALPIR